MKKGIAIFMLLIFFTAGIVSLPACRKSSSEGNVIFYSTYAANSNYYPINITLKDTQKLSGPLWQGAISAPDDVLPNCASDNGAVFLLQDGPYNFSATSDNGVTWDGSVTVTSNGRFVKLLQ